MQRVGLDIGMLHYVCFGSCPTKIQPDWEEDCKESNGPGYERHNIISTCRSCCPANYERSVCKVHVRLPDGRNGRAKNELPSASLPRSPSKERSRKASDVQDKHHQEVRDYPEHHQQANSE